MYSQRLASELRKRGHDAISVHETELEGEADDAVLEWAARDRRALLTNDLSDLARMADEWAASGQSHCGLIFTDDSSLSRSLNALGRIVRALDNFLQDHPDEEALRDQIRWLP